MSDEEQRPPAGGKKIVRFGCYDYPELRVLISRGNGSLGGDKYAVFHQGACETDDPATIEQLRKTAYVYEDETYDVQQVPVQIVKEEGEAPVVANARAARDAKRIAPTKPRAPKAPKPPTGG